MPVAPDCYGWARREPSKAARSSCALIGHELAGKIEFICSDMWRPYLEVIAKRCPQALNILDRFHMVAKLNKALDELIVVNHASEARRMVREGYEPVLKNMRWCLLKRPENLTDKQTSVCESCWPTT